MRHLFRLVATLGIAYEAVRLGRDETNIRRLARHLGCSLADARRLYQLSRQDGYGSAYATVFGDSRPGAAAVPLAASDLAPDGTGSEPLTSPRPA
jgi:hypothetical protein